MLGCFEEMTDTSEEEASLCFCPSGTTEAQPGGLVLCLSTLSFPSEAKCCDNPTQDQIKQKMCIAKHLH